MNFAIPQRWLDVPHGQLAYWKTGRGPDVLAIHGWPLHSATYRHVLPFLSEHFTVHLLDLPGAGQTAWNSAIGFESNASAVLAAVDQLGLSDYALLAHDSGGVVARIIAARDPRVSSLVIAGSEIPGHHPKMLERIVAVARRPRLARQLIRLLAIAGVRHSKYGFGTCFEDPKYSDGEFYDLMVAPLFRPEVFAGQFELLKGFDFAFVDALAEVHAKITAPTLCIWGERDPYFPVGKARAMLPQFGGGAELVAIPGAKLYPHEDHARAFADHALAFLTRRRSESSRTPQ